MLTRNEKPDFLTPLITGPPFLDAYYKRFSQLFIDDSTNLISLYTKNTLPPETHSVSITNIIRSNIRKCLPFRMFRTVFNKLHEHSHTGIKVTCNNTFSQCYCIPYLEKRLSIFIQDCIECQRNKYFNMKIQTPPTQSFSEHAPSFNSRISMDTKGHIYQPFFTTEILHSCYNRRFQSLSCKSSNQFKNAETAIKILLHHWIIKFDPPMHLATDRGSE